MRLIDADALLEKIWEQRHEHPNAYQLSNYAELLACEAPTIDAVEVVHGQWICQNFGRTRFKCSVCHAENYEMCYHYCPNCGAKMDGERKNDDKRTDSTDRA